MKVVNSIINWADSHQGVLALLLALGGPLLIWFHKRYRELFPTKRKRRERIKEDIAHAQALQKEIESKVEWDNRFSYYGEFLIRDIARKLPETNEFHSSVITPHCIAALITIHNEYLEFTTGSFSICHIKQIGDGWFFCDEKEEDAIKVQAVMQLQYRDIEIIRWDTNEYWEWPQIHCRFTRTNKFPFSKTYYARKSEFGTREVLLEVCPVKDVRRQPKEWLKLHST